MLTMQEQIEKVLRDIPFDRIRENAFKGLDADGIIQGQGEDIGYMMMEQNDLFRNHHMKYIQAKIWEIVYRRIRKTMAHGIKEWTQKRHFDQCIMDDLEAIDIGVAG